MSEKSPSLSDKIMIYTYLPYDVEKFKIDLLFAHTYMLVCFDIRLILVGIFKPISLMKNRQENHFFETNFQCNSKFVKQLTHVNEVQIVKNK